MIKEDSNSNPLFSFYNHLINMNAISVVKLRYVRRSQYSSRFEQKIKKLVVAH